MDVKINKIKDLELYQFGYLESQSAITFIGIVEDGIPEWVDYIKDLLNTDSIDVYVISGKEMNYVYGLKGRNAYKDNLTIAAIPLEYFDPSKVGELAVSRFDWGGRWFSDIVANNKISTAC